MSYNRCQGIQRSLGENNDFILYMFEEDIRMIEKWAAEPPLSDNQPTQGVLLGLWTNTLNPVVHVVLIDGILPEDYLFIKNPQYLNNPMFTHIGYWYFKDARVVSDPLQASNEYSQDKQISTNKQRRLVYLAVEQHRFHPILFDEGKEIHGKVEPLPGQNPFRLPDEPSTSTTEEENVEKRKGKEKVASLRDKFESVTSSFRVHLMQRPDNQESASYASVTKQGNQEHQPIVSSNPPGRYGYQTSADNAYPAQCEDEDVSTCTKQYQWYVTDQGQKTLHEISSKLKEITDKEPKISRDNDTHNVMILFSFEDKNYVISFPPRFPGLPAELYRQMHSRSNRCYADYYEIKSRNSLQLVREIIDIISKGR